jgi:hypothetical protein
LADSRAATVFDTTSRFHMARGPRGCSDSSERNEDVAQRTRADHLRVLRRNYKLVATVWQPLISSQTEHELGIPPVLAWRLLEYFWTWQQPIHCAIYKPCK